MEKDSEDIVSQEKELEDEKLLTKTIRIGSLFQIMFYNIHNGYQETLLHIITLLKFMKSAKVGNSQHFLIKVVYVIVTIL